MPRGPLWKFGVWFYSRKVAEGSLVIGCPGCGVAPGEWCQPNVAPAAQLICIARTAAFLKTPASAELRALEHAREVF